MTRAPYPEDLHAELEVIELRSRADRADALAWTRTAQLVDEHRLTVATVARVLRMSERTIARRLATVDRGGPGRPQAVPQGRERSERP